MPLKWQYYALNRSVKSMNLLATYSLFFHFFCCLWCLNLPSKCWQRQFSVISWTQLHRRYCISFSPSVRFACHVHCVGRRALGLKKSLSLSALPLRRESLVTFAGHQQSLWTTHLKGGSVGGNLGFVKRHPPSFLAHWTATESDSLQDSSFTFWLFPHHSCTPSTGSHSQTLKHDVQANAGGGHMHDSHSFTYFSTDVQKKCSCLVKYSQ